jgi:hypothetical protein
VRTVPGQSLRLLGLLLDENGTSGSTSDDGVLAGGSADGAELLGARTRGVPGSGPDQGGGKGRGEGRRRHGPAADRAGDGVVDVRLGRLHREFLCNGDVRLIMIEILRMPQQRLSILKKNEAFKTRDDLRFMHKGQRKWKKKKISKIVSSNLRDTKQSMPRTTDMIIQDRSTILLQAHKLFLFFLDQ